MSKDTHRTVERVAQVKRCLQDEDCILMAFRSVEKDYVFFYDVGQRALFLGEETQPVDLMFFWHKHQVDGNYCIACELMLCFDERWIAVPGELPVELGLDTGTAKSLLQTLRQETPCLEHISVESL